MDKALVELQAFIVLQNQILGMIKRLLKYKNKILALKWEIEFTRKLTNIQLASQKRMEYRC